MSEHSRVVGRAKGRIRGALIAVAVAWTSLALQQAPGGAGGAGGGAAQAQQRGAEIFARQCADCHGATGRGDGPVAYLLDPKPRNFAAGTFRVVSTANGVPSDDDLLATLRRGMPGSAMPPWGHLPESDLRALVAEVRRLVVEGSAADAQADDPELGRDEALADALDDYGTPGPPAAVPPEAPRTADDLERGRALYLKSCAACHGEDGRARVPVEKFDSEGYPIGARDFTRGIFKGGSRGEDIARRVWIGMPGTPMPSLPLKGDELWPLVRYVESLIDPQAEGRVLQSRHRLVARRVAGPLGVDPDAAAWNGVEATWVAVMPLWWRHDRVEGLSVQALHDGKSVALRLEWADPTRDDELLRQDAFADAVALELSADADPPFFGMGSAQGAVNIWQWKAAWQRDARGRPELLDAFPNLPTGALAALGPPPEDVFQTATAAGNPLSQPKHGCPVENAVAHGQGTLATQPAIDGTVDGAGRWKDGRWAVVLLRDLSKPAPGDVLPRVGQTLSVAFAVWDGAAGDRDGRKSVTIWHQLALED